MGHPITAVFRVRNTVVNMISRQPFACYKIICRSKIEIGNDTRRKVPARDRAWQYIDSRIHRVTALASPPHF